MTCVTKTSGGAGGPVSATFFSHPRTLIIIARASAFATIDFRCIQWFLGLKRFAHACTWRGGNKPPKRMRLSRFRIECGYQSFSRWAAAEPVLDANILGLPFGPAQFLLDVAWGYERAVGWSNTLPSSPTDSAEGLIVYLGRHGSVLSCSSCSSPTDGNGDQSLNLGLAFPRVKWSKSEGGVQERKNSESRPRSFFFSCLAQSQREWGRPPRAPRDDAISTAVRRFELKPFLRTSV